MKNLLKKLNQKRDVNSLMLGEKLWKEITYPLPKAIGVIENDTPRVNRFATEVKS